MFSFHITDPASQSRNPDTQVNTTTHLIPLS
jgi:hypothetical protein